MPARGKTGKPTAGFPLFPPPLEIPVGFPHFHRLDLRWTNIFFQRPMRHARPQSQPELSPVRKGLVNYVPGKKCKGCPGPLTGRKAFPVPQAAVSNMSIRTKDLWMARSLFASCVTQQTSASRAPCTLEPAICFFTEAARFSSCVSTRAEPACLETPSSSGAEWSTLLSSPNANMFIAHKQVGIDFEQNLVIYP